MTSEISGFYKLSVEERLKILKNFANLTDEEAKSIDLTGALDKKVADMMIENVVGTTEFPLGIATNFLINGKDYFIPMVLDEPSVVAAASHAAKLSRPNGFKADADEPLMIGEIQLVNVNENSLKIILENKEKIKERLNNTDSTLIKLGGGLKDVDAKLLKTSRGNMIVVFLTIDVRDAMGANVVNTMCEAIAPFLEDITSGTARLRIVSNLATKRLARCKATWKLDKELIEAILDAYELAKNDQYRCTTHNKGIMNGIDAVLLATCNDFRAVESAAHSYASIGGYHSLTKYYKNGDGDLVGEIELPIAVGIVGGCTKTHPIAKIALKILNLKNSKEFACVLASVGLATNFAALRALVLEGIQRGHMKLHAKNIAIIAGAEGDLIEKVSEKMIEEKNVSVSRAGELLEELKN